MRRRIGICASAFLFPLGVWLFGANMFSLGWHATHGFHREINGVRFYVPLLYREDNGSVYNEFSFYTYRSALFSKEGSITIDFPKHESGMSSGPMYSKSQKMLGVFLVGQRAATLAGQPGNCFEYGLNETTLNLQLAPTRVWIQCRFGPNMEASFNGSANAAPDLYKFLAAANRTRPAPLI